MAPNRPHFENLVSAPRKDSSLTQGPMYYKLKKCIKLAVRDSTNRPFQTTFAHE